MKLRILTGHSDQIIILTPGFPADEDDTSCLPAIQNFVEAMARRHAVAVFAFQYPFRRGHYIWKNIPVYSAGGRNRFGFAKLATWIRILGELRAAERDAVDSAGGVPVVHSFWVGECALIGHLASRLFGWRHVITIGGQEVRTRTRYTRLLRRLGALSNAVVTAGSEHAARAAEETLDRKVDAVIPLGLDVKATRPRSGERDVDVLGVGSLIPVKRYDEFVDVVLLVLEDYPHVSIVLVGDGPERKRLTRRVAGGLSGNVKLLGQLPREEVLVLMSRSKILLHPSEFESQGYVFLEALASGMNVVCRDVGAPGFSRKVIRCASPKEMAAAIREILRAEPDYEPVPVPTTDDSVDAYEEIYRTLQPRSFGGTSQRS